MIRRMPNYSAKDESQYISKEVERQQLNEAIEGYLRQGGTIKQIKVHMPAELNNRRVLFEDNVISLCLLDDELDYEEL